MRYTAGAALLAASAATVAADDCSQDGYGNYYCNAVDSIVYKGVGNSGTYSRVSSMNMGSGACSFENTGYSGSLAPFDEEVCTDFLSSCGDLRGGQLRASRVFCVIGHQVEESRTRIRLADRDGCQRIILGDWGLLKNEPPILTTAI